MSTTESNFIRPDGSPARILVVDDESVLAELLGSALRHQGWETKTAANGWEALDKAMRRSLLTSMKSLRELTRCFADLEWLRSPLNVF